MRRGNPHAVVASHQHAVLGSAQMGDTHGEPYPDRQEGDGKRESRQIPQHAMAKIIRFFRIALVAG
jgi:hypothetical protein